MKRGPRMVALIAIVGVVVAAMATFALVAAARQRAAVGAAPAVAQTRLATVAAGPRIVFRSTAPGDKYGLVAMVPLADPGGPRALTDRPCDRVDATANRAVCLRTVAGIATTFRAELLDASWRTIRTWALPGAPSRTRFAPDGTLLATTAFVTGHSYMTVGFATQTDVNRADGTGYGNVEDFTATVDGAPFAAADRNFWGVTFVDDDRFYATAASASAGKTWLMRGSLTGRILTSVRENAECPSLSPDGTKIAYKKRIGDGPAFWSIAVLDLASGTETVLGAERRSVDDQVEWLDDSTVLYGLPRPTEAGVTDVWSLGLAAGATPTVLIPQAWSPSVVR
jgi:hypothetical protein